MKKKLPKNWQPDEEYFWGNNADKHQMTNYGENRSWCEHQLHGFKMYWCKEMGGSGKPMVSWDLTYWNRCKVLWDKVDSFDKRRMYREEKRTQRKESSELYLMQKETLKLPKTTPMSSEKRIEFADYLSRSINNE